MRISGLDQRVSDQDIQQPGHLTQREVFAPELVDYSTIMEKSAERDTFIEDLLSGDYSRMSQALARPPASPIAE